MGWERAYRSPAAFEGSGKLRPKRKKKKCFFGQKDLFRRGRVRAQCRHTRTLTACTLPKETGAKKKRRRGAKRRVKMGRKKRQGQEGVKPTEGVKREGGGWNPLLPRLGIKPRASPLQPPCPF